MHIKVISSRILIQYNKIKSCDTYILIQLNKNRNNYVHENLFKISHIPFQKFESKLILHRCCYSGVTKTPIITLHNYHILHHFLFSQYQWLMKNNIDNYCFLLKRTDFWRNLIDKLILRSISGQTKMTAV